MRWWLDKSQEIPPGITKWLIAAAPGVVCGYMMAGIMHEIDNARLDGEFSAGWASLASHLVSFVYSSCAMHLMLVMGGDRLFMNGDSLLRR